MSMRCEFCGRTALSWTWAEKEPGIERPICSPCRRELGKGAAAASDMPEPWRAKPRLGDWNQISWSQEAEALLGPDGNGGIYFVPAQEAISDGIYIVGSCFSLAELVKAGAAFAPIQSFDPPSWGGEEP